MPILFSASGQYADWETGLHYNYFRDYDPTIGRYIERDPIGLKGGGNTYQYGKSNSLMFFDELGLNSSVSIPGVDRIPGKPETPLCVEQVKGMMKNKRCPGMAFCLTCCYEIYQAIPTGGDLAIVICTGACKAAVELMNKREGLNCNSANACNDFNQA